MNKAKRIVERPWGTRRNGSWVIRTTSLIDSLKKGEAVQLDKITVGTKNLVQLLRLLPGEYCRISANGRLEVETVELKFRRKTLSVKGNKVIQIGKASYRKPKHYHNWFALEDGAWLKPYMRWNPVILKPRKF